MKWLKIWRLVMDNLRSVERSIPMIGKDRKGYGDAYWSSFHGFDRLEKEIRADGCYQGKASHFARWKMKLKDKIAIITGAGRGIGKAYALRFAAEGAKVVIAEIDFHNAQGE